MFIRNYGWLLIEKLLRMILGLYVIMLIANHLGSINFGIYSLHIALAALLYPFTSLSMQMIAIQEYGSSEKTIDYITKHLLFLYFVSTFLVSLLAIFTSYFYSSVELNFIFLIMLISLLFRICDVFEWLLLHSGNHRTVSRGKILSFLFASLFYFGLVATDQKTIWFVFVYSCEWFFVFVILGWKNRTILMGITNNYDYHYLWKIVKKSLPLVLASFSVIANMRFDQLMINHLLGESALGIYSVAVRVVEVSYTVPLAALLIALPRLLSGNQSNNLIKKIYRKCYTIVYIYCFVLLVLTFSCISSLGLYIDDVYISTIPLIKILSVTVIPVLLGAVWSVWIVENNKQYFSIVAQLIAVTLNILLNIFLIPKYGLIGAAYATSVSYSISFIISIFLYSPLELLKQLIPDMRIT
jgi:O-antigen/teichoic acid export membrane protein